MVPSPIGVSATIGVFAEWNDIRHPAQ